MLLVAQDVHDRYLTERMFTTTLPWTVVLILLLGLLGGALMSRNMLRRLDAINRTSGEIIAGDLTRRVPRDRLGRRVRRAGGKSQPHAGPHRAADEGLARSDRLAWRMICARR